jgi:hypothetical protein
MSKYIITGKSFQGALIVEYRLDGLLHSIINETSLSDHNAISKKIGKIPCDEKYIYELAKIGAAVKKAPADLSFKSFWDKYAYKVGKKDRAEKLWGHMNEAQRIQCLNSLPAYERWLSTRTVEKAYPETYLAQRRWENEFPGNPVLFK